jgi:hypothetical protein
LEANVYEITDLGQFASGELKLVVKDPNVLVPVVIQPLLNRLVLPQQREPI